MRKWRPRQDDLLAIRQLVGGGSRTPLPHLPPGDRTVFWQELQYRATVSVCGRGAGVDCEPKTPANHGEERAEAVQCGQTHVRSRCLSKASCELKRKLHRGHLIM